MIVTEGNVHDALVYLSEDPHPLSVAIKEVVYAENGTREAFAREFLHADGGAEIRKQHATISAVCIEAKKAEAEAIFSRERHRSRVKAAEMILEIWRTENANARAAERIR